MDEKIVLNIRQSVLPFIGKLKQGPLDPQQLSHLQSMETSLQAITAPIVSSLRVIAKSLTPTELEVARMIKEGRRTREIADKMHLSKNTIMTHRFNIRNKLKLLNSKTNLRSFLQSLS
jgi:DNA-binding NarL/FixJ family response regulator